MKEAEFENKKIIFRKKSGKNCANCWQFLFLCLVTGKTGYSRTTMVIFFYFYWDKIG